MLAGMIEVSKGKKEKVPPPMICINSGDLPAVKDWKLGEEYEITVKMTRRSEEQTEKGTNIHGCFELVAKKSKEQEGEKEDAT